MRLARPKRTTPIYVKAPDTGTVYLSELVPVHARNEKGCTGRDRSFNAHPLTLGGRTYERGLGIHPNCDLAFDLEGRFPTFEAVVGSDLEGETTVAEARDRAETVEFMVIGDGKMIYQTGRMKWNSEPRHIYVPIPGVRRLELKLHRRSGPRWLSGPADWAIARVGEPLHNRVAVADDATMGKAISLDGEWELAGFEQGTGIASQAHYGAEEARADAVKVAVPGSVYAAAEPKEAAGKEWWYWREFDLPAEWAGKAVWVEMDGAAYQADAWLNGRWIGRTVGPFVQGRFNATVGAKLGGRNVLAVRVIASPAPWAKAEKPFQPLPASQLVTSATLARHGIPPLGIWRGVRVAATGPLVVRSFSAERTGEGKQLRMRTEVENIGSAKLKASVMLLVPDLFRSFEVEPGKTAIIDALGEDIETGTREIEGGLHVPFEFPPIATAAVLLEGDGQSDAKTVRFVRHTAELAPDAALLMVNGNPVSIRACVWAPSDALLRPDKGRVERLLAHAQKCGFNALLVQDGAFEADGLYDLCDKKGIFVLQGLSRAGQSVDVETYLANVEAMVKRLQGYSCIVAWCVGGANGHLAAQALALVSKLDRTRLIADSPSAGEMRLWSTQTDPKTKVVRWRSMTLPCVPAVTSPSTRASLGRDLPWPSVGQWPGDGPPSLPAAAYGPASSAWRHILSGQTAQAAAVQRALESSRLKPGSSVLSQLNEPAASSSSALIDYRGVPKPAYYAVQRARAATAVFLDVEGGIPATLDVGQALKGQVWVQTPRPLKGARVRAELFDTHMFPLGDWNAMADIDGLARPLAIEWKAATEQAGDVVFLHLSLADAEDKPVTSNLIWLGIEKPRGQARKLRVAWMGGEPRGVLADEAFQAAAGIELVKPDLESVDTTAAVRKPFADVDVIAVEAETVLNDYFDADLRDVADAVKSGCGLLVFGQDHTLHDSALGPVLPVDRPADEVIGEPRRPSATEPNHPALSRVSLESCPVLAPRAGPIAKANAMVLAELDPETPLLVESTHGDGRVIALLARPGELAGWRDGRRFFAGLLGYLHRLGHVELSRLVDRSMPAPLRALGRIGPATIETAMRQHEDGALVVMRNTSPTLAFMIVLEAEGDDPGAVTFSDNAFWLMPGRSCGVVVTGKGETGDYRLALEGWNVERTPVPGRLTLDGSRIRVR
jgi:hypothetical protein